jgi:hypothetical protein
MGLACPATWIGPAHASVNLVQNGDFLLTSLSSPGGYICALGATCTSNITDWGSACSSLGFCGNGATPGSLLFRGTNGVAWNSFNSLAGTIADPPSGNYVGIDGDPTFEAPIFQTINGLTPGDTYRLQFYQAAAQQAGVGGATTEQWSDTLGGGAAQSSTLMSVPQGGFSPWVLQTMDFKATSASEVLNFMAIGTGAPPVALLADVSLTAVPEPATWAMLVLGFAGLGFAGYRRAKKNAAALAAARVQDLIRPRPGKSDPARLSLLRRMNRSRAGQRLSKDRVCNPVSLASTYWPRPFGFRPPGGPRASRQLFMPDF